MIELIVSPIVIGLLALIIGGAAIIFILLALTHVEAEGGEELLGARLYLNEETLRITAPIALSGKPDQVWRLRGGALAIVDTKRRASAMVFKSDIIQLSAYRYLLAHHRKTKNEPLLPYGFIRIRGRGRKVYYRKVTLVSFEEIEALYTRAGAIRNGSISPTPKPARALCSGCGHQQRCASAIT